MIAQDSIRGRTANPHGQLDIRCENCHTSTAWKPIRRQPEFDHDRQTTFKLQGLHREVACQRCHTSLVFSTAPTRCSECHADLHRRQFGSDCQRCHTVSGWKVSISAVQQHSNRFPLIGAHAVATCDDCHHGAAAGVYTGLSTQCVSCHLQDYQRGTPLNHVTAKLPVTCETCHGINVWTDARFDHTQFTSFALTGAHATVPCAQCHANGVFAGTAPQCVGCHLADYNGTTNPNHKADSFSTTCEMCHNTTNWQNATFDHNLSTFPLTGAHVAVPCAQCHVNGVFGGMPTQCVGCHLADFQKTTNPNHATAGFPQDCATCHTTTDWTGVTFNHAITGFALAGVHTTQQCVTCHVNNNYSLTSAACITCHLTDFNGANDPPHQSAGFPQDCTLCHGSSALNWTSATFDHTTSGFTLTGAHTSLQCAQCHLNSNYSLTSGACWSCHQTDYNNTNNPPHKQAALPQDCSGCHSTTDWNGATFNHATTAFTLVGVHASQPCAACHVNNNYSLTSVACITCHLTDFNGANNPPHQSAGFPQDCTLCHGSSALNWTSATFDHTTSGFTLTGAHTSLQCAQCHLNSNYSLTSGACWNCHQTDYNGTNNPSHKATNFPQDCSGCHTTADWNGATFNHATTAFALAGVHATQQCAVCHVNNNYNLTSAACINCHLTDFNGANNPPHQSAGFPQDCTLCHGSSASNWTSATFDHTTTGFALVGLHVTQQCAACHVNGNYSLASAACINCHLTDFNGTTNPPHKAAGFPQDCTVCHGTSASNWTSAAFNHTTTGFTLTGSHISLQCVQCHVNNNYSLTSGACWNCHQTDYNGTNNPPHKSANFSQDCSGCHTTTDWTGAATFNHATTTFTLVGVHATQQCAACHVNNNYSLTSAACINCHLTDFNGANNPPHQSAGFPQDCTQCHGSSVLNWTSATFNHTTTGFTLTGAHTSQQCAACHVNSNYSLTSGACWNCHQTDYNGTNNPPHKATNFPQDCSGCHTTTDWTGATTFNHATSGFTLVGVHATQQCAACHVNNNYNLTSAACINCHLTDFNGANNPPHQSAGFPQDCTVCHGTSASNWTSATFNHTTTGFTLTGAHTSQQCAACHVSGNYSLANGACWNCHQTDYNGTNNPSHKATNFPQDCSGCHTTTDWNGATFNHASTTFALVGVHATQQCAACHVSNNYNLTSAACWNCHQTDFNGANNPPHQSAGFPQDCTQCHGSSAANWTSATFNHTTTGFTLTGAHTSQQCAACHVNNNYSLASGACWNCHQTDYNGTNNPSHKATNFPQDCSGCHTTTDWNGATFNHASTTFTLVGVHASQQCAACHVNNNYSLTSAACWNCHQTDYNNTTNPAHKSAGFPQDCTQCHGSAILNWTSATFNHTTTGFTLTGAHTSQQCAACHVNSNYSLTSAACWNCHQTDYNGTNNPPHKSANFPQDCSGCHTTTDWNGATFNHASTTFTLVGVHATQQCAACHVNNNYSLTSAACINCHLTDFNGANTPPHQSAGFPQDCTQCHGSSAANWTSATFNHTTTGFTLTGAHTGQLCAACHVNNNYSLTSAACWNCHQTDYNGTNNPPHKSANFPQDCSGCHTTTDWTGATFNHASTTFTLVGVHATQQCAACHVNNNYNLTSAACWNCHQTDYNNTTNPAHKSAGFPQDCTQCHGSSAANWTSATFNHTTTGFTLTGAHATQQCAACHVNNNYSLTSAACWGCHQTDYNGTNNPPHKSANFPQDCSGCHTTTDWTGATFNHATAGFTLVGVHATQQCAACHVSNNYSLTSAACWNCHQTDYNGATNPAHQAAGFPQDCTQCHGSSAANWTSATFNHATTGLALVGVHASQQCAACHVNNNYSLTSAACWSCHQTDYNNTTNPAHKAAGFPQDCTQCHGSAILNWTSATFNHTTTGFTLTGAHTSQQCVACHVNGNYSLTSAACWNCHQTDYNGTNNPPHKSANFPQDCSGCHTTTDWTGATFNHASTTFTLVGVHATQQCAACHVNNNYSLTSAACWNCHQTDYNNTTNPAHKSAGFPQDCTQCHGSSAANWTSATFNHATTGLTLVGVHATQQCAACHVNGNYSLTSAACWNCHQTDYNGATNPPHQSAGFPQDCTQCHGSAILNWTSATFNHATTGFTLTGAHTSQQCTACHVSGNYSLTSGACWNCHQTDYNGTTNPPHKASGFPQDCSGCHTTTDWTGATFNHATTGFTLTGTHLTILCAACHVSNNYSLTSAACWNCHQTDYNGTTNPPHQAAGFPQDCSVCHSTTNWSGATFTHPTTPLQLTGYHATMLTNNQCSLCHVGNNYTTTPSDCYSCHQTDYNGTTNPGHAAAAFATTCGTCHTFVDWTGAKYTAHDAAYFPIYSGNHNGKWTTCADCHTNSSNYSVFSCIVCHQHSNQTSVTSDHSGVKSFVYNGTSCYGCHPKGSGG